MDQDKTLTCTECGADFVFTIKDQQYYSERGFVAPKRCKPCREAKKQKGFRSPGGGQGGGDRGARNLYDATCAACGKDTTVPFKPIAGRPVYCRDCYKARAGGVG